MAIQINFFLILPLPDETQKWKYFTQKFQIISQKKKKNPPEEADSRPLSLNLREIGHIPIQTLLLAQNLVHIVFAAGFLISKEPRQQDGALGPQAGVGVMSFNLMSLQCFLLE